MNEIGDYGVIGDCHSMALVGRDGSIDWLCFPRFDSPSVFARVLDEEGGGHFRIAPAETISDTTRTYLPATNVLATTFVTPTGVLELTDCMPVDAFDPDQPARVRHHSSVLRRVRCTEGTVTATVDLRPRFEYGVVHPRFRATSEGTAAIIGGPAALWVRATEPIDVGADDISASWELAAGEEAWIEISWTPAAASSPHVAGQVATMAEHLERTIAFWEAWLAHCSYDGDHVRRVHRSALVLKLLTFSPTGAVLAAGTTSLPEWIGGGRNWDYRFTWIRDATLTLASLVLLGYLPEAAAFKGWIERTGAGRPEELQIMYRATGERLLPELELDHLAGHRDSRPVRIGNGAAGQLQLDSFGQLLDAAYLFGRAGGDLTVDNASFLRHVADLTVQNWQRPDQGIWEIRDHPRHFVHSKLNCWVALDRAVKMSDDGNLEGDVARWRHERDAVADWLLSEACPDGWFVQAAGHPLADAATLLVPALGFLPPADDRVQETIEVVMRDLSDGTHVHRYRNTDGLAGDEGAFLLCSFWLVDALVHSGRVDEAEALLDRLLALGNDVHVYAEMVDPSTGAQLGNTPQAFTHMAVVTSASAVSAARRGELPPPTEAFSFVETSLERRIARGLAPHA